MIIKFDSHMDEALARGGSFDLTGTTAKTNMQFGSFEADAGTVLETLKGVAIKTAVTTLAGITAAEIDLATVMFTALSGPLLANVIYRADGYVITNVKLTSGSLHLYRTLNQITS